MILNIMNQVFSASVIQFSITIMHLKFRNDNVLVNKTHSLTIDFMVNQFERGLIRTKIVYIYIMQENVNHMAYIPFCVLRFSNNQYFPYVAENLAAKCCVEELDCHTE